jgi:nitroreductase
MSIQDTIQERYSVRAYRKDPIADEKKAALLARLKALQTGPLGSPTRFSLVAADSQDRASLRGLGTYGFIKDPTGFILGAVEVGDHALEDYGYMMEKAVLEATAIGLGTCWLGGSFTQSSFARKMGGADEIIPPWLPPDTSRLTRGRKVWSSPGAGKHAPAREALFSIVLSTNRSPTAIS